MFKWWLLASAVRNAEGGGGGSGGGEGGGAGGGEGTAETGGNPPAAGGAGAGDGGTPATRPDWLPEQFFIEGKPAYDKLGQSYSELRRAFDGKQEKLRETIAAELAAKAREGVPETADGYVFEVPKELLPEGFEASPPAADDPMLSTAREVLHELGAKPEQWNRLRDAFVKWQVAQAPDLAAAKREIGEGADQRIETVDLWVARQLNDERLYKAVMERATDAPFVLAMEKLMRAAGHAVPAPGGMPGAGGGGPMLTASQVQEAMRHPDYYHEQKGAEHRAKVDAFFKAGGRLPGATRRRA